MLKFSKGAGDNQLTFPITQDQLDMLKPCQLASPMVGKSHGLKLPAELSTDEGLQTAAREIEEVRAMVARQEFPREFMEKYYPEAWGMFPQETPEMLQNVGLSFDDPQGLADVVHMDDPMDFPKAAFEYVRANGGVCKDANPGCVDFIEIIPETNKKLGLAQDHNIRAAFEAKYYFGIPRPEEVLGYNMTHYPEGCPDHPDFPTGHGAFAAAVSILLSRFKVSDAVKKQIRDAAYVWSMARSLAGVHYGVSNVAGLSAGGLLSEKDFNQQFAREPLLNN